MGDANATGEDVRKAARAFPDGVNQKVHEMLTKYTYRADEAGGGAIESEGLLDLSGAKSPDDIGHIRTLRPAASRLRRREGGKGRSC